jgi:four helix bundle protein
MKTFKDLDVWQRSVLFATEIYVVTKSFPKEETYGLISQLRRASVSIASNLAEGSKKGKKEFSHFIKIAQGSGAEIETQLIISNNLGFLNEDNFQKLLTELESIMRMLTSLYKSVTSV